MKNRPILVTGSHRSGSTWVGKIIGSAPRIRYIHEPFNIDIKRYQSPLKFAFEHVPKGSSNSYHGEVKKYLGNFFGLNAVAVAKMAEIRTLYQLNKYCGDIKSRAFDKRMLIKDPLAVMAAEWLFEEFNCQVIVCIRHPAAFVASLKVKQWEFDFTNFIKQPNLINSFFPEFAEEVLSFTQNKFDIIRQGTLLWKVIYTVICNYKLNYAKDWHFVVHEELSRNPIEEFKKIFDYLGVDYCEKTRKKVVSSSIATGNTRLSRNSMENIQSWKNRLSTEEIEYIKKETSEVWTHYYSEEDWG
ncbi:MAG: sulfotransferase domain-containing protein [Cyclobacteriaceae bacterium]